MRYTLALASLLGAVPTFASVAQAQNEPLSIRGFGILNVQADYITPRGLMVTNSGMTIQVISGLVFGLVNKPDADIDNVSLVVGTFNNIHTTQHSSSVGAWNEFDWFAGPSIHFLKKWTLDVQIGQFLSPPGFFKTETNLEFALAYDDSGSDLPVKFKPYVKWFNALSGDSTVVTGRRGGTFDIEIGAAPSIQLMDFTISAPTWITVGPESFWGGGGNVGVFSTGLTVSHPLPVPSRLGSWNVKAGFQYYNFINERLRFAQTLLGTAPAGSGGHQDAVNGFVGLSFGF